MPLVHASSRFRCPLVRGLALVLALAGCDSGTITDGVTDSTFVATMAELERVERAPGLDSSARVAARAAALQRRGLTPQQVEAAAGALADDPQRALAIWRAIDRKVSGDSLPAPAPGAPAGPARRR